MEERKKNCIGSKERNYHGKQERECNGKLGARIAIERNGTEGGNGVEKEGKVREEEGGK